MAGALPTPAPCLADAHGLLQSQGLHPSRVIDVHSDAILWVDEAGKPRTTFVSVTEAQGARRFIIDTRHGFVV